VGTKAFVNSELELELAAAVAIRRERDELEKTLADPSAGWRDMRSEVARQKFESSHALQRACGCVYTRVTRLQNESA
jgi:hypothetical protein